MSIQHSLSINEEFISQATEILQSPEGNDYGKEVRPKWSDGSPAHTQYITQVFTQWNGPFVPITTLRNVAWKAGLKEILALYQSHAQTKQEFEKAGVNWWTPWFGVDGTLGKSYAYQLAKKIQFPEGEFIQFDRVLWLLRNKPMDRRIITNMLNLEELVDMTLPPCAFMTMWSVSGDKLNLTLIQRSGDFLPAAHAGGINMVQYYFLLAMVAQVSGYRVGNFTHYVNNLHIYDRHVEIVRDILKKSGLYSPIKLWINPDIKDFYNFTFNDIELIDYPHNSQSYSIPIAE